MSSKNSNPSPDAGVASPCVRRCCLDDQDVCLGCGRLLADILAWSLASTAQRETICTAAALRLQLPGSGSGPSAGPGSSH